MSSPTTENSLNFSEVLPAAIKKILAARGFITEEDLNYFFKPTLKSLSSPDSMKDVDKALALLVDAYKNSTKIAIYGDFDMDGTPGVALLKKSLELLGYKNILTYQPRRLSEGYGVHAEAIKKLYDQGAKLLITVDVGITSNEGIQVAKDLGMDVILTDHHLPNEVLPPADAIIDPHQKDCMSGLTYLCGTGVAFYLIMALKKEMKSLGLLKSDFSLKEVLDLLALATLTDVVPLVKDNRVLVKHGLLKLSETNNLGIKSLMVALELYGEKIYSDDVVMKISPKLNSLSRLDTDLKPLDVLVTPQENYNQLAKTVLAYHKERVELMNACLAKAEEQYLGQPQKNFIFVYDKSFHPGVVGLIAARMAERYKKPVFAAGVKMGKFVGSARLPDGLKLNLKELLNKTTDELVTHGGHSAAAGFGLTEDKLVSFSQFLENNILDLEFEATEKSAVYDLDIDKLNARFMTWYDGMEPFGEGFPVPQFKVNVRVSSVKPMKGGHYRFICNSDRRSLDAVYFSPSAEQSKILSDIKDRQWIEAIVQLQWNRFLGNKKLQFLVKSIQTVG